MKTKIQLAVVFATLFTFNINAQNKTIISATNSDISDNLDLTAVSSIFGESQNLNDFERRLNDPRLQISNLDLNNDNQVDYLRVIESVENNAHIIIIQSILGRDLYQDIATIEVEKDRSNKVSIQIVGNSFIYGQNYIYEPQYSLTPQIYASFWTSYYRPYYSTWTWNVYPSFYIAWNPYPVYRYRQNVYGCVNYSNTYTYVNYRRCYRAPAIYTSYSCNSYERKHPEYAFSRRNSSYSNHYELNQRRYSNRNGVAYSRNNTNNNHSQREYSQNRTNYSRATNKPIIEYQRDNSQNRTNSQRTVTAQRTEPQRDYSQNRENTSGRNYSQNMANTSRESNTQRDYSQQGNNNASRESNTQRGYSQANNNVPRENNTQRSYSQSNNNVSRENNTQRSYSQSNNNVSRENTQRATQPQRDYSQNRNSAVHERTSQRNNESASRNNNRRS